MDLLDQFDEWGNPIDGMGAELPPLPAADERAGSDDDGGAHAAFVEAEAEDAALMLHHANAPGGGGGGYTGGAIVLHEDRKLYPSAEEVYPGAETLVQDEDTQPLSQPIVAPVEVRAFSASEEEPPRTIATPAFLGALMSSPALIRNVALVGHLHHGKTTLADLLIEASLVDKWDPSTNVRYTDARSDEQDRGISLKATPFSVVAQAGVGAAQKSFLLNAIDAPGHPDFSDELCAALRLADGAVLVVDALEGVMMATERAVRAAVREGLPLILCIGKVDRLILDLRLPPADAYHKLVHLIAEVNACIANATPGGARARVLTPLDGTVVFSGALHGWSFSLESFAAIYAARWLGSGIAPAMLAKRLWGDVWYNPASRTFQRTAPTSGAPRSFISFVLEPLYKVYSSVVGSDAAGVAATAIELGLRLKPAQLRLDVRPLLKLVLSNFLGGAGGLVDSIVAHVPSPVAAAPILISRLYTGDADAPEAEAMRACDASGPLMINIVKLVSTSDASAFYALGRVMSGTVSTGQRVRVLGEAYCAEDAEDMQLAVVRGVSVGQARYRLNLTKAPAGCIVLLEGLGDAIAKGATVTSAGDEAADAGTFRPLSFNTTACVNVSVEPLNPSELPKVLAGLRALTKSYPLARTRVEESGEHVLIGCGELAMDSMLRDLREMYARVEVKVADPVVSFAETVIEQSSMSCFAFTPNKLNKISVIAEQCEKGLPEAIEMGALTFIGAGGADRRRVNETLQREFGWDLLAAKSLWAFGPSPTNGPNVFLDDTLLASDAPEKRLLASVRESLVQGFQWGCREGPLCDEPVRGVKVRLIGADIAGEALQRGGGQIIPTARRAVYSAFLLAAPRLLEPVFGVSVCCPAEAAPAVHAVLQKRRGHVVSEAPRPGTPFTLLKGVIPAMDAFGFETDLRILTAGQAFALQAFDHWALVPGDPMDKAVVLRPLEPSPPHALAREFMVKTRRRKGLPDVPTAAKYMDPALAAMLTAAEGGVV